MQRSPVTPSPFRRFAHSISRAVGTPSAFVLACLIIVVWGVTGPLYDYSDTWQLAINTGTTIVTFLMCFVIQNTQNRDSQVVQLKLDELIRAVEAARTELVDMEDLSDEELHRLQHQFEALRRTAEAARRARESGQAST
ncbi:MAG TPA: low affinity iron permease family protein [Gemmatimonadaceae bacterium]|nr:low affinity iron permease family protein [Gemmatimonadaceae bacterium]